MEGPLTLRGARCRRCSATTYPAGDWCSACGGDLQPLELSGQGRLWSWTVQRHPPKSPPYQPPAEGFSPFAVGYVELPEGVRVAAVLDLPLDKVTIGMPLLVTAGRGVPRAVSR